MIKKIIPSSIKHHLNVIRHRGTKYKCPFCGYSANEMALIGSSFPVLTKYNIVGANKRRAGCFKCGSRDRERLIYLYLRDTLGIYSHKEYRILHIAPEKNLSEALRGIGFTEYICGDLFTEGYEYPDYVQNINILDIPFEENSFDLVICNHVLEHIIDDTAAMSELYRVLKPSGRAILQVPISKMLDTTYEDSSITTNEEREKAYGQYDHVRIYGNDYVDRLKSVGFNVDVVNVSSSYAKYGVNQDEDIYLCTK